MPYRELRGCSGIKQLFGTFENGIAKSPEPKIEGKNARVVNP
jgi:hypothetical protein